MDKEHWKWNLFWIVLGAFLLRIGCALPVLMESTHTGLLRPDSYTYMLPAKALLADGCMMTAPSSGVAATTRPPGYILILALFFQCSDSLLLPVLACGIDGKRTDVQPESFLYCRRIVCAESYLHRRFPADFGRFHSGIVLFVCIILYGMRFPQKITGALCLCMYCIGGRVLDETHLHSVAAGRDGGACPVLFPAGVEKSSCLLGDHCSLLGDHAFPGNAPQL